MQAITTTDRSGVVELVPGRLLRLGSTVALDGNISWVPRQTRGNQPMNVYLLFGEGGATLIDTGVAAHREVILAQLEAVLPPEVSLRVFLTRSEFDCIGNIAAIAAMHPIDRLLSGGNANPFDGFDQVTGASGSWEGRTKLSRAGDDDSIGLEIIPPEVRLISTFWAYDKVSKALFTSDLFGHTILDPDRGDVVIDDIDLDPSTSRTVRDLNGERYHWFAHARSPAPAAELIRIFSTHDVEIVAPTHGCVLRGKQVIRRHLDFLLELLPAPGSAIDGGH